MPESLHFLRVTRIDNRLLEDKVIGRDEMHQLADDNLGLFAGGYRSIETMERQVTMLARSEAARRWVVAVASKQLLSDTIERLGTQDVGLSVVDSERENGFSAGNLWFTTVEKLSSSRPCALDGVILFDPACHVHRARSFIRRDGKTHDRPQLIANFLSDQRAEGAPAVFCLMTLREPRAVGSARIAEAYMQDGWWFADPYSLSFVDG